MLLWTLAEAEPPSMFYGGSRTVVSRFHLTAARFLGYKNRGIKTWVEANAPSKFEMFMLKTKGEVCVSRSALWIATLQCAHRDCAVHTGCD